MADEKPEHKAMVSRPRGWDPDYSHVIEAMCTVRPQRVEASLPPGDRSVAEILEKLDRVCRSGKHVAMQWYSGGK